MSQYVCRLVDVEKLRAEGRKVCNVSFYNVDGKRELTIKYTYKYFPVINVISSAVLDKLNSWKGVHVRWRLPKCRTITVNSIMKGYYYGLTYLVRLIDGAELWE